MFALKDPCSAVDLNLKPHPLALSLSLGFTGAWIGLEAAFGPMCLCVYLRDGVGCCELCDSEQCLLEKIGACYFCSTYSRAVLQLHFP